MFKSYIRSKHKNLPIGLKVTHVTWIAPSMKNEVTVVLSHGGSRAGYGEGHKELHALTYTATVTGANSGRTLDAAQNELLMPQAQANAQLWKFIRDCERHPSTESLTIELYGRPYALPFFYVLEPADLQVGDVIQLRKGARYRINSMDPDGWRVTWYASAKDVREASKYPQPFKTEAPHFIANPGQMLRATMAKRVIKAHIAGEDTNDQEHLYSHGDGDCRCDSRYGCRIGPIAY